MKIKKNLDKLLDSVNGENVTDYNLISANFEEINNYYSNIKNNCNVNLLKNKIDEKIKVLEKFYKIDIDRHVKECLDDVLNEIDPDGDGVISDIELDIDNDGVISDLDEKQFISRINDIVKKKCTHPKKIPLDKLAKEIGIIFNKRLKTQDKKGAGYKIIYGGGNSSNNLKNISNEIKINSNEKQIDEYITKKIEEEVKKISSKREKKIKESTEKCKKKINNYFSQLESKDDIFFFKWNEINEIDFNKKVENLLVECSFNDNLVDLIEKKKTDLILKKKE